MKWCAILVLCFSVGLGAAQQLEPRGGTPQREDPCKTKFRIAPDPVYCDRYWECLGGEAYQYNCPNGLVFVGRNRGIADGCDYPWRGNYCHGKERANPPIQTEHCDWLYGIFGHETSCTRYWTCWNGTASEQFCIGGLLYSEDEHSCDWPRNVGGCQKHPLCTDDPEGNVPLGQSCERYWSCQGGYPRLQRCPATLVFDRISRRCVHPPTEDCDVPPPPPPEVEDRIRGGGGEGDGRVRGGEGGLGQNIIQEEGGQLPPRRRARPRRPPLLFVPEGASPLNEEPPLDLVEQPSSQFREPPIEGAIPFN